MAAYQAPSGHDVSEPHDHARETGLLGADFVAGAQDDPAACAASVIAEQALSIFDAAAATASEIEDRGRRHAEELTGVMGHAAAGALSRLRTLSRELDGLAAEIDRRAETRLAEQVDGS
jgi:hypothetical protein